MNKYTLRHMSRMSDTPPKSRDLDHLMEQNSTELDFLSAYGGSSSEGDGSAIFAALRRFLKAGGVPYSLNKKETTLSFAFGKASIEENGCLISFKGKMHLEIRGNDFISKIQCLLFIFLLVCV